MGRKYNYDIDKFFSERELLQTKVVDKIKHAFYVQ